MKKTTTLPTRFLKNLFFVFIFSSAFFDVFAQQQAAKYPSTFLWRISGNGLTKPSYLYGTMHLTDKRLFYFGDSLYKAIEETEGLAIEVHPDELSTQMIQSFTKEDNSTYLKDAVDKEQYKDIKRRLEKRFGFKADKLTRRQAYLAKDEWLKDMRKPDDMQTMMDAWLYNIARNMGKWTGGIEDLEDQLRIIEKEEETFAFEDLLIDKKLVQGGLNRLIDIYLAQDLQAINDFYYNDAQSRRDEWLNKRNLKMSHRMDSIIKHRTCFFAIGAAHLPGDSGVIKLLLKKGFKVDPVFSSQKISPENYKVAKSEMKWQPFTASDSLYQVSFPSKSTTMFFHENVLKMEMCIDIPTATYYLTCAVPNMRPEANKEKLIEEMLQSFTSGGKTIERKKITDAGQIGVELLVEKDGYLRVKGFLKGNYAFINVMGHESKKEIVKSEMAEKFFSSFKVSEKNLQVSQEFKNYVNEEEGFSILMPQSPQLIKTEKDVEGWISKTYSAIDLKNNVFFLVVVRSTSPGFYLNGDSNYFALQKDNWAKMATKLKREEYFKLGNFPAMRYDFKMAQGKDEGFSNTLTINRGNRSYLLIAATEDETKSQAVINSFFNSFQLTPYKQAKWKTYTAPGGHFSAYTPDQIVVKKKKEEVSTTDSSGNLDSYLSYDSLTAVSYEFLKVTYTDYYYTETDSALFHDAMYSQIERTDSVISKKYLTNGKDKSQDIVLLLKDNQNYRRIRMILHGDTMYMASAFLHPELVYSSDVNKYFDEMLVLTNTAPTSLYTKRTKELFADLNSGDSTRFRKAAEAINGMTFEKEDLPLLKEALLKQYELAEEEYDDIYDIIADHIISVGDSAVLGYVRQKYFSPVVDNELQKLAMLQMLAQTKTKESYMLLKHLMLKDPPLVEYIGDLEYKLRDSLQLTAEIFPALMKLSSDSLYYDFTASLALILLDSNLISMDVIKPFEENLILIAKGLVNKIASDSEADTWREQESLHLLARLNSTKGNEVLQQLVALNLKMLNSRLIIDLLVNKQSVAKESIELVAADKEFRFGFYNSLESKGLLSFFPAKYSTQKSLAESDVYIMASDEYSIENIVFIDSKIARYKGEEKRFYLFKVKIEDEEGWYLGISGGYSKDLKVLAIKKGEDIGGIYWNEEYNPKKGNEQFENYLKEYLENND